MPRKSTALPPGLRPLVSIEDAAQALSTTTDVMMFLFRTRRLGYVHLGSSYLMRADDLDDAIARRDDLVQNINVGVLTDWRAAAFERQELYFNEVAAFFGVSLDEVRKILDPQDDIAVDKATLWTLIVAGAEIGSGALTRVEERIETARRLKNRVIPDDVRAAIYSRDEGLCRYCGCTPKRGQRHIDHVLPRARGGGDDLSNLVTACTSCNSRKHDHLPHEAGMTLLPPGTKRRQRPRRMAPGTMQPPSIPYQALVMGVV